MFCTLYLIEISNVFRVTSSLYNCFWFFCACLDSLRIHVNHFFIKMSLSRDVNKTLQSETETRRRLYEKQTSRDLEVQDRVRDIFEKLRTNAASIRFKATTRFDSLLIYSFNNVNEHHKSPYWHYQLDDYAVSTRPAASSI